MTKLNFKAVFPPQYQQKVDELATLANERLGFKI
jgi:hypothetical protein